ncbi:galactokinase [Sphingomonas oryzagri]|uniref:Galactokinase n=1 Tax=Sphingomonas oryzagri TaxID=3042314 RepID=A0ABT6N222_9SPHN|nr:galactokinase [Sphingomonas oryzagri]MDH7639338.1 galactokinase [Sphingomonas oryzagri]
MSALHERLLAGFGSAFGGNPDFVVRAPGRVNLIGEHTDYNDGFALPVAIGVETRIAVRPRPDRLVRSVALDFDGEVDGFWIETPIRRAEGAGWRDYVRGSVDVLARRGFGHTGVDMAIAGDIPKGTGLSSSASLEVAVCHAMLAAAGHDDVPATEIALMAQEAENDFVGMRCGNLDQIASAATQAGAALLIDCRSLLLEAVTVPDGTAVMIVQSGVVRGLVEGHYNRRRAQCEEAAAALGVKALRDVDLAGLEDGRACMPEETFRRARHIVTENARTLDAAGALRAGDLASLGRLMAESHVSMRDDFGITVEHTDRLSAILAKAIGERGGARQTGGGFGGAVVAVMPVEIVERVREAVLNGYRTPDGGSPLIMIEQASAGAGLLTEAR